MRQVTTRRTPADQLVLVGDQTKKVMMMVTDNKEDDDDFAKGWRPGQEFTDDVDDKTDDDFAKGGRGGR